SIHECSSGTKSSCVLCKSIPTISQTRILICSIHLLNLKPQSCLLSQLCNRSQPSCDVESIVFLLCFLLSEERRRSRSGSRDRELRRRERKRSRSRDRERRRSRSRSPAHRRRSRSPRRHRSSSSSPLRQKDRRDDERKDAKDKPVKEHQISEEDMQGKTEEEIEMMKIMGFGNFDTTKGKKTEGAVNAHAINVSQKRKYRQYMNRKGGFNRPLDFIA
uniref:U4/U6.U5 small nuclear ribonucleoprotein 27 kDa protein n=1 Tax=Esox lucius TaxID=8010 RepID=A0A3P8XJH2_ESOLU